jgi:bile acid:Na+ symporter, BASS family
MTIAHLVLSTELLSSVLIVFDFGLRSTVRDATTLFRHPLLLVRSVLATSVLMPLFAASIVAVFSLRPAIGIALIALAVSPVPPFLPGQQNLSRSRTIYSDCLVRARYWPLCWHH